MNRWKKWSLSFLGNREELGVSPVILFGVMLLSFWLTYWGA